MSTSEALNYAELFELSDPLASRPLRLNLKSHSEGLSSRDAWNLATGQLVPDLPIELGGYRGSQITDFLWSGLMGIVCVSNRVVQLLTEHRITGWQTYPVRVFDRRAVEVPGYAGLSITGSQCNRDRSRSHIIEKPAPTARGVGYQVYRGLYFDESQWDKCDMFWIRDTAIVVTAKVRQLMQSVGASNVRFARLTDVEIDVRLDDYEKAK